MSAWVPGCSGRYRVLPPLPDTLRCGTPLRACRKSLTLSLHSSSRRSAWNSSVERMARSRLLLMRVGRRRRQQLARLVIAERRRLAFAAFRLRPLDAFDRVMGDGVLLAEIFEQRGQRREPVPDRAAAEPAPHQVVAPGDDVRARHGAKFLRPRDAGEAHEVLDRVLVGAAGVRVGEIGEPLDLGRHVGQPVKLGGGQQPAGRARFRSEAGRLCRLIGPPARVSTIDKIC